MPRVKEAEFCAEGFGNLARVWCDLRSLWRNGYEHLNKEVGGWHIGGVERTDEANLMLGVCCVKAELFMQFADRRLLRSLVAFYLASWEGDPPPIAAVLCATN